MIPVEINRYIEQMMRSLEATGELSYGDRRKLKSLLKGLAPSGTTRDVLWCALEILAARTVIDVWTSRFSDEAVALQVLAAAEADLSNSGEDGERMDILHKLQWLVDAKLLECAFATAYAGGACWAAGRNVFFEPPNETDAASDAELDIYAWDASYFASLAYEGGDLGEPNVTSRSKRRVFWTWFLVEALPSLFEDRL